MKHFCTLLVALAVVLTAKAEEVYTEWTPLGTATVNADRDVLNNYAAMFGTEFVYTSEVSERHLSDNPDVQQFKFTKFLGHCDFVVDVNVSEGVCKADEQPTDILVGEDYKWIDGAYDYWHLNMSSGQYSPARKVLSSSNFFFNVKSGYGFQLPQFSVELPDAQPEIDFTVKQTGGGVKSTDRFIKYGIERSGIASIRYAVQRSGFTMAQLTELVKGEKESKAVEGDEFTIEFDDCGAYYALLLAYDADGKYMGIYHAVNCLSNLEPAGTWEDAGTAVWHHPFSTDYYLDVNGSMELDVIAEEHRTWPVKLEKRTDLADREIYRVVNPYGTDCPLNADIERRLAVMAGGETRINAADGAYRTDDTFWYVFDATDPAAVAEEYRPNGCNISNFWGTTFGGTRELESATLTDGLLRISYPAGYSFDLTIEMPGYRGVGTVATDYAGGDEINITVGPNVRRVAYTFVPVLSVPTDEEIAAAAQQLAEGGDEALTVSCEGDGVVSLPVPDGTERPCVAVVVGFDAEGKPFAASTIDVFKNTKLYGSTLSESLFSGIFDSLADKAVESEVSVEVRTYVGGSEEISVELPFDANHPHVKAIVAGGYNLTVGDARPVIRLHPDAEGLYQLAGTPVELGINFTEAGGDLSLHMWDGRRDDNVISFATPAFYVAAGAYNCTVPFVLTLGSETQDSIDRIEAAESAGSVEYFNLQGVRVSNPRGGMFIERRGRSSKVVRL